MILKGRVFVLCDPAGGVPESEELRKELISWVRKVLGPVASPDALHWAPALPKTRSGKIMRRILRKIAANELDSLGDTSTLAEPAVVDQLIATVYPDRQNNVLIKSPDRAFY